MAKEGGIRKALDVADVEKIKTSAVYTGRINKIKYAIFIVLAISFAIFVVLVGLAIASEGLEKVIQVVEAINFYYIFAAFGVIFVSYVFRYPKWEQYMKRLKVSISRKKNFVIYMSMYSMDITPGRWGRAVVSYTINRLTGIKFAKTFPAVVADIFTDFLGFAILTVSMAFLVRKFELFSLAITAILLVPFVFIYTKRPFRFFKRKIGQVRWLKPLFDNGEVYFKYNKLLDRRVYFYSMLFTIPSMFINGFALYLVILAFGINLNASLLPTVLFIYSSSLILGMITGLPATLGVTDAALIGYLTLFFPDSITFATASLITIFFRLASVWFVEGFGFTSLAYTLRYWKEAESHAKIGE